MIKLSFLIAFLCVFFGCSESPPTYIYFFGHFNTPVVGLYYDENEEMYDLLGQRDIEPAEMWWNETYLVLKSKDETVYLLDSSDNTITEYDGLDELEARLGETVEFMDMDVAIEKRLGQLCVEKYDEIDTTMILQFPIVQNLYKETKHDGYVQYEDYEYYVFSDGKGVVRVEYHANGCNDYPIFVNYRNYY